MVSIGFKNHISSDRIVAIIAPDSRPTKNLVSRAKQQGKLIDATMGKRTKSVIIMDSDHVVLSANSTDTIVQRIRNNHSVEARGRK
ncbi:MAG: DUF370 domain-containing protein [Calditrichaeota bacterium]|nr:MAG: DUF370 domain-containing protein [Calditrichota bacterium]